MSIVADNIRALRTLFGSDGRDITQQELADIAGVTRETVCKWESGAIGNIRDSNINRLRTHFGLSVDDLRSESHGLAAQVANRAPARAGSPSDMATLPFRKPAGTGLTAAGTVEVPVSISSDHPDAFVIAMPDASMDHVFPANCHLVVSPTVPPATNDIVLADVRTMTPVVRRALLGGDTVVLVGDSHAHVSDIVANRSDVDILGTVIWFQQAGRSV